MSKKTDADARERVADALPHIVGKALGTYQNLINMDADTFREKSHKNYYDSCKAAVSHLQVLLKLAEWVQTPTTNNGIAKVDLEEFMKTLEQQAEVDPADLSTDEDEEMA